MNSQRITASQLTCLCACQWQKTRKAAPGEVLMSVCHLNSHSMVTRLPFNEFFSLIIITLSVDSHLFSPSQNSSLGQGPLRAHPSPGWPKTCASAKSTKNFHQKIAKPKQINYTYFKFSEP